jgi:hypothetical protein
MGGSRGQKYMFTGLDVVDVSYRGGHVIHGRAAMRRAHLARMGVAAKLEAAAASPRLLDRVCLEGIC